MRRSNITGHDPITWHRVNMGRVVIAVACDALSFNGKREGYTARECQKFADQLNCITPTPKIVDSIYNQADVKLVPHPQIVTSPNAEDDHNKAINDELRGRSGLIADVGKYWVLCKDMPTALNYGWHYGVAAKWLSRSADGASWVIQGNPIAGFSRAHNYEHWDYSQTYRPVMNKCLVDGQPSNLQAVYMDPYLSFAVSTEGALPFIRMPGVAQEAPMEDFPFPDDTPLGDDPTVTAFLQARGVTPGPRNRTLWLVLHSIESQNAVPTPGVAMAVARWFGGPSAPPASVHYLCDPDNTVQGVRESEIAWHACGANKFSIGIEQAGQTMHTDWFKEGGPEEKQIRRVAELAAGICKRWNIPLTFVDEGGLLRGEPGITMHSTVSGAYRQAQLGYKTNYDMEIYGEMRAKRSDHGDPGGIHGERWDMQKFISLVKDYTS